MTQPATAEHQSQMRFDVFATRMLYVVVFFVASLSTVQGDLWWLLRAGKDIWHTHQVSLVDQYSYTARGDYWPNHEWLWEVVAYLLHRIGGMPLLTACTAATITATVVVLRRVSPATGYIAPIVVGAALPLMSMSWTARPQATSTLLFAITLLLLVRGRELWLPPLFLLWANLHAQVVLGGILLGTVWVASLVEASRARTGESRHRAMRLTMVMVVAAAATLVTPLGFRLWSYVLGANGRPGQHRIAEWESAFHLYISNVMFWITLILIVVLAVARRQRLATWERRVSLYAVLATAPLAMFAVRNIPVFAAAAVPVCMTLLEFHTRKPIGEVLRARELLVLASAVSFALIGLIWAAAPPRLGWNPMPPALVRALEACPGPLYNNYNAGATLIWWVPDVKVFVDNRQDPYSAEVIDAGLDHEAETYRRVFARWHVRCALVVPGTPLSTALGHDGWRRTFYDGASEVWADGSSPRAINASE